MNILVVEDDENKRNQLVHFFAINFKEFNIHTSKSLRSGIQSIVDKTFDLIITDMTMPTFDITVDEDGGRVQAYAGREILRYMQRRNLSIPVIVVTQFDRFGQGETSLTLSELHEQLAESHAEIYRGVVYYDTASESWKEKLVSEIDRLGMK